MKTIALLAMVSVLLSGCYTESYVYKSNPAPPDKEVLFLLTDGSYITSPPGRHSRMIDGYQVSGALYREGTPPKNFEGHVHDRDIEVLQYEHFDAVATLVLLGVTAGAVCGIIIGINSIGPSFGAGNH